MSDIFEKAVGWKANRVLYQLSREEKKQKYQQLMTMLFTQKEIDSYFEELHKSKEWKDLLDNKVDYLASSKRGLSLLYSLIRKVKPNVILETGVQRGCTTLVFLMALKENKHGKLISIDYCQEKPEEIAMYVPDYLRDRWTFYKDKTCNILPTLNETIDIFFHDSLHTYDNMYFEYEWAWKHLKKEGLLMSHDIGANNAFFDFADNYAVDYYFLNFFSPAGGYGAGVIVKGDQEKIRNIVRKESKIKTPICPLFDRSNFGFGMAFAERCKKELNCEIKMVEGRGGVDEPILKYKNRNIAQIAPRHACRFGGYIKGKSFRITNEEEEEQLFEIIKEQLQ